MIRKPYFKLNWKYALGELILIFLGISLAIWFNNWNDSRKDKNLERSLLNQIYDEIDNSLGDVESDLSILIQGLKSHYTVYDAINSDEPYSDELAFHFFFMQRDEYTYPILTTYESAKLNGLKVISDDTIRYLIERLYEFEIPRVEKQQSFYPDISQHYGAFYNKHFKPNTDLDLKFELYWADGDTTYFPRPNTVPFRTEQETIGYIPLDFEGLKKNKEFKMLMSKEREYRNYKIRQYQRIVRDSELIKARIAAYLGEQFSQ